MSIVSPQQVARWTRVKETLFSSQIGRQVVAKANADRIALLFSCADATLSFLSTLMSTATTSGLAISSANGIVPIYMSAHGGLVNQEWNAQVNGMNGLTVVEVFYQPQTEEQADV